MAKESIFRRLFGRKAVVEGIQTVYWVNSAEAELLREYHQLGSYSTIFRTQPAVYTIVDFLARNIAQLNLKTYRRVSRTDRREDPNHPVARLIQQPNPNTTRTRLIHGTVADLAVYGNAYWLQQRAGDRVMVERLLPSSVSLDYDDPTRYRLTNGLSVSRDRIAHFRFYNPDDPRTGLSPLEPLRRIIAEDYYAGRHREGFWRNAARHDGIIERPADAPGWSQEARDRFREEWQAKHSGGVNAGKTVILEDGMKWNGASFSPKDSEYIAGRKLTREEVAAAYHVSPAMIGILEHANFANINMQHRMLYQDTLGPWLSMLEQEIALQVFPWFPTTQDIYVEFNIEEKLQGSFEEQAAVLTSSVGAPWLTRNEARALRNLPRLEDPAADEIITPLNVTVGGQPAPNVETPLDIEGVRKALRELSVNGKDH